MNIIDLFFFFYLTNLIAFLLLLSSFTMSHSESGNKLVVMFFFFSITITMLDSSLLECDLATCLVVGYYRLLLACILDP